MHRLRTATRRLVRLALTSFVVAGAAALTASLNLPPWPLALLAGALVAMTSKE